MTWWRYVLFGCGQLGIMAMARFFFQSNVEYSRQKVGPGPDDVLFDVGLFGLALMLFRVFDAVTDPVAGVISDRWVRRGGERRSLLALSLLIQPVGLGLMFAPHPGMDAGLRWTLLILGMFVFFTGYTIYGIPYWSLVADYGGDDQNVRRGLSNALGAGLILATAVVAAAIPGAIASLGYGTAAVLVAVPAAVLSLGPYLAQPPGLAPPKPGQADPPVKEMLATAFGHRRFVAVLVIFAGSQMSFTVMTASAATIAVEVLGGTQADTSKLLAPFILAAIPAFVAVPLLSKRFGWERSVVAASLLLGVVYAATGLLGSGLGGLTPLQTAGLVFACGGPMAAALLGIEGDAIATCARESGGELTSVYFAAFNFVIKFMNGLAVFGTGLLIKYGLYRACGPTAGALLALGCAGYFLLRPRAPAGP